MNKKTYFIILAVAVLALMFFQNRRSSNAHMIGLQAPAVSGKSITGQDISLERFRGDYVLLDFWASWCGPCRRSNSKLVDLHEKFKDRNFVILNVSLDKNPAAWRKAIEADGLNWPWHLREDPAEGMPISESYGVERIPSRFLIDPQGKIIAVNPGFGRIDKILTEKTLLK